MQYVLTEQELEELRGHPKKALQDLMVAHKKEIQQALTLYFKECWKVTEHYVPPEKIDALKRELEPAVMELGKSFQIVYQ